MHKRDRHPARHRTTTRAALCSLARLQSRGRNWRWKSNRTRTEPNCQTNRTEQNPNFMQWVRFTSLVETVQYWEAICTTENERPVKWTSLSARKQTITWLHRSAFTDCRSYFFHISMFAMQFLPRDAMQVPPMPSCVICLFHLRVATPL